MGDRDPTMNFLARSTQHIFNLALILATIIVASPLGEDLTEAYNSPAILLPEVEDASEVMAKMSPKTPAADPELSVLLEVQAKVNEMKKKGLSDSACKSVAEQACKEVENEHQSDQKEISSLSDASECLTRGEVQLRKSKNELERLVTKWKLSRKALTQAKEALVPLGTHKFKSLKVSQCAFFNGKKDCSQPVVVFPADTYAGFLKAKAEEAKVRRESLVWISKAMEGEWSVQVAYEASLRMKTQCFCNKKKIRDTTWKSITSPKRQSLLTKMDKKCRMMTCMLAGTPASSPACKSRLTKLKPKKLIDKAEDVRKRECRTIHTKTNFAAPNERQLRSMLERVLTKHFTKVGQRADMRRKVHRYLKKYIKLRGKKKDVGSLDE